MGNSASGRGASSTPRDNPVFTSPGSGRSSTSDKIASWEFFYHPTVWSNGPDSSMYVDTEHKDVCVGMVMILLGNIWLIAFLYIVSHMKNVTLRLKERTKILFK